MDPSIIVAIITSACTIVTVVITAITNHNKTKYQVDALSEKIDGLTAKVEAHNTYDRRIVALETTVAILQSGRINND